MGPWRAEVNRCGAGGGGGEEEAWAAPAGEERERVLCREEGPQPCARVPDLSVPAALRESQMES